MNGLTTYDPKAEASPAAAADLNGADRIAFVRNSSGQWWAVPFSAVLDGLARVAASASAVLNRLLPSQTGQSGKVLGTDGTNAVWQSGGSGDVGGPGSATANAIALFNGTGGKTIKDSAVTISTDGSLASNSDSKLPTEKAVKSYVDLAVTGLLELKGSTDCSANPNYPAGLKGDVYFVTAAGKIGGASGKAVGIGDVYFALADNAGGAEASVGTSWDVLRYSASLVGALLAANNLSDLASAPTARNNLGFGSQVAATDGATVTFNLASGLRQKVVLGGNRTLALSNDADGMAFVLCLQQDGTGSRTVTWPSGITTWFGTAGPTTAPVLSTAAGKRDYVTVVRQASGDYDAFFSKGS